MFSYPVGGQAFPNGITDRENLFLVRRGVLGRPKPGEAPEQFKSRYV